MTESKKTCMKCGQERPLPDFWIDRKQPDGRWVICKYCGRKRSRARRARLKHRARQAAYRQENPEIVRARHDVRQALRHGKMEKPEHCELCGVRKATEAHHEDYRKPLEVWWLCRKCHGRAHEGKVVVDLVLVWDPQLESAA